MAVDREWVLATIAELAGFSEGGPGITRLAFSDEDRRAGEYIQELMRQAGLTVRRDTFGNIIGRLDGALPGAPAVATGSHLDTVPEGGRFDGVLGVVGGLAAIRRLAKQGPLTHPLELIVFMAEESSRFGFATMGSKAMTGLVNPAWAKAKDHAGISFADALGRQGLNLADARSSFRPRDELKAFIELHIEQGPVLERTGKTIGIVEAIAAPTRLKIIVEGMAGHSGTTPMDDRQDALVSAAMIILAVQEIAMEQHHRGTVGTVGVIRNHPNVMNVIPGRVEMGVDIRGVDHDSIIETIQDIKDAVSTIADGQETPVAIEVVTADKPVPMNNEIIETIESVCGQLDMPYRLMNSGAGHDAMNMAAITSTGMIFIPCRGGVSHNPAEDSAPDDIMKGIDVLTATIRQLAK
ncbi:Zn-dependent hydrolase [Anaeroselena agilis]|uniref:Zn-dependent hydrolase n=1 Tax=Anaeroselena agilis TaxID=3063788 RepID=A0ABU3NVQ2_9FIRM|nr:Zn-dependent hydrolase [Selenomonadales bacterium 4137-cl]